MRIVQILPTYVSKDAIGNEVSVLDELLRQRGFDTAIFTNFTTSDASNVVCRRDFSPADFLPDDIVLYHFSIGSSFTSVFNQLECKKALVYHNVTPPSFFTPYDSFAAMRSRRGLEQVRYLALSADCCLADSETNKRELISMGYSCPIEVLPVCFDKEAYLSIEPSKSVFERFGGQKGSNILFVGRVSPNKCQHDVISAFYMHKKLYDADAKLFIVGAYASDDRYYARLREYVSRLGLKDVYFTGSVGLDEIVAYYQLADLFLCQSEHEGFCVPLVESIVFDVPIIAYDSTAVGETLGGSGVLLNEKDPYLTAAVMRKVVIDEAFREGLVAAQKDRFQELYSSGIEQAVDFLLGELTEEAAR